MWIRAIVLSLKKIEKLLVFYSLLTFILVNGIIWYLTSNLVNKRFPAFKISIKNFFVYLFKFGVATLIFSALIYLFAYSTIKSFVNPLAETQSNIFVPLILTLIMFYFMYISFSLLNKIKLKNIMRSLYDIGIKKAHIVLLTYAIIILIASVFSLLLFYLIEKNLFLLFISVILIGFAYVWSRIFLVLVVDKLV